jgi:hypothetical protein
VGAGAFSRNKPYAEIEFAFESQSGISSVMSAAAKYCDYLILSRRRGGFGCVVAASHFPGNAAGVLKKRGVTFD